jgi:NTP pyrophosphatase (non-canonical NTP hydrolase)
VTFDEYQKISRKTASYPAIQEGYVYPALGLLGEAGEVAEKVKKAFRDDDGKMTVERRAAIQKELGDVLWYMAALCTELGFSFEETAQLNLKKTASRMARGQISGNGDDR